MPLQDNFNFNQPSGNFEPLPAGYHIVKVMDITDAGIGQFDGKPRLQVQMEAVNAISQDGLTPIQVRDWVKNSWWSGEPQPSKLYTLYKAAGLVNKKDEAPASVNDIVGKQVGVQIFHKKDEKGNIRGKVKKYLTPKMALAAVEEEEVDADEVAEALA